MPAEALLLQAVAVLNYDNGMIDDKPEHQHQTEERIPVEGVARRFEHHEGDGEAQGYAERGHQRISEPNENEQEGNEEHQAEKGVGQEDVEAVTDLDGRIIEKLDSHSCRKRSTELR